MKRYASKLPLFLGLGLIVLVGFGATHRVLAAGLDAAGAPPSDSTSLLELLKPVYNAFAGGHYAYAAALGVIAGVALLKRYAGSGKFGAFVHGDFGGSLSALLMAAAGASAAALAAPGAHVTLALLKSALLVGIGAAGGYAMLKNLIIEPLLKRYGSKLPSWMQPLVALAEAFFGHGSDGAAALAKAQAAGDAAVAAKPAQGVAAVTGTPTEIK